jgi:O-antigen/teichoic acid export membrane protein
LEEPRLAPQPQRSNSIVHDVASSLVTQLIVVAGNIATLRLAASLMTPADVGELALVRRVLVFLTPIFLLGLGVGLPRSIGRALQDQRRAAAIVAAGCAMGIGAALLGSSLLGSFRRPMARLLFGSEELTGLIVPLVPLLLGNQAFLVLYAVLRGQFRIRGANLLQIIQIALLPPVVVLLLARHGLGTVLFTTGVASAVIAAIAAVLLLKGAVRPSCLKDVGAAAKELVAYGIPRVPGDAALTATYAVGPILAAHQLDLHAAGSLAIGMNMVIVLSAAFGPLGVVLLPRMSRSLARGGDAELRARLPLLCGMAMHGGALLAVVGGVFGNDGLRWILGRAYVLDPLGMALLSIAAAGNVVFVVLRSTLDAACFRPVNSIHASIALGVLAAVWFGCRPCAHAAPFIWICAAIAASFTTLAVLTLVATTRRLRLQVRPAAVGRWIGTQGLVVGCALGLKLLNPNPGFIVFCGMQLLLAGLWLAAMRILGVSWPFELARRIAAVRHQSRESTRAIHPPGSTAASSSLFSAPAEPPSAAATAAEEIESVRWPRS